MSPPTLNPQLSYCVVGLVKGVPHTLSAKDLHSLRVLAVEFVAIGWSEWHPTQK